MLEEKNSNERIIYIERKGENLKIKKQFVLK